MTRAEVRFLVIVAALGLLVSALACFILVPAWEHRAHVGPAPDANGQLAQSLIETGTLGFGRLGANPTTARGPGFALWLAPGVLLGGSDVRWLAFWGSVPSVLAGCALAWMLLRRYGTVAAVVGAFVSVLHPLPVFVAGRLLGDGYHGALGMLGLVAFDAAGAGATSLRRRSVLTLASAACFALHGLSRSTGLLTLLALVLVTVTMDRASWRRLITVLAIVAVPAAAWSIRSSRLEGRPVIIQSLTAYNFWLGEGFDRFGGQQLRGESRRRGMELVFDKAGLDRSRLDGFWWIRLTPDEIGRIEPRLASAAKERILEDPAGYGGRVLRGLVRYWIGAETAAPSRIYALAVLPVLVAALWGAVLVLSRRGPAGRLHGSRRAHPASDRLAWSALVTIVLTAAAYAAIIPMARYSVQVYPELGYLAGIGAAGAATWWVSHPRGSPTGATT